MSECAICQHAKRPAIDADIADHLALNLVAVRYHVPVKRLEVHRDHLIISPLTTRSLELSRHVHEASTASPEVSEAMMLPETPVEILNQGLPYVRQALRLAGADRAQQQQLIDRLNDVVTAVLLSEDMGVP